MGVRGAFKHEGARSFGGRGNPTSRDTTEGVPIVARVVRKARHGGGLGRAGQRTRHREVSVEPASRRSFGTGEAGARDGDEGRQRLATCTVKAAPADEARAVRHARRREAPAPEVLNGVTRSMRKRHRDRVSHGRVDRSWPVRTARPSCPTARTARTERAGKPKRTLTPYGRCAARVECAHIATRNTLRHGSRVRS